MFQVLLRVCEGRTPGERGYPTAGVSVHDPATAPSVPNRISGSKSQENGDTSCGKKLSKERKV